MEDSNITPEHRVCQIRGCKVINGDCLDVLRAMPDNSIDSAVTDPPYGLKFMGKKWDCSVPGVEVWRECLRVLKPGGYLLSFAGTRTYHRMAVNIEDAGFNIRDMISWVYGSGMPKGNNISKAIARKGGRQGFSHGKQQGQYGHSAVSATDEARRWDGWNTTLKPSFEPIVVAQKPISEKTIAANVLKWGTGAININGCRVPTSSDDAKAMERCNTPGSGQLRGRDPVQSSRGQKGSDCAAKPLDTKAGRWPANLVHDGSQGVLDLFPMTKSGVIAAHHKARGIPSNSLSGGRDGSLNGQMSESYGDQGSAARFFYCAKAGKSERNIGLPSNGTAVGHGATLRGCEDADWKRVNGNHHPTVKPRRLMQWLVRMVTPLGGTVLDFFMGSGTTGMACAKEGFLFIGIELDPEYFDIACARIAGMEK